MKIALDVPSKVKDAHLLDKLSSLPCEVVTPLKTFFFRHKLLSYNSFVWYRISIGVRIAGAKPKNEYGILEISHAIVWICLLLVHEGSICIQRLTEPFHSE